MAIVYKVTILTPEKLLTTVLEVVKGETKLESVTPVGTEPAERAVKKIKKYSFVNGMRMKGIRGTELILNMLDDHKPHPMDEIKVAFEKHGFAANSHSAALSLLKQEGRIRRNMDGTWEIALA